jgi:type I restriction enzyme R subunit
MNNYNEADTRAKLVEPSIHCCGQNEDFIRRRETAGTVEFICRKARLHQGHVNMPEKRHMTTAD